MVPTYQEQSWPGIAANATPALAVEHAVQEIAKRPISLAVSGINYGENVGTCVTVSGTIGAALEAAEQNIPALAISLELLQTEYNNYSAVDFSAAIHFTRIFAEKTLATSLPDDVDVLKIYKMIISYKKITDLTTIRKYLYTLIPKNVNITKIFQGLVKLLLRTKISEKSKLFLKEKKIKRKIITYASKYEHNMKIGNNDIFHLEAFIFNVIRILF